MSEHGCLKSESFISLGVKRDLEVEGEIRANDKIFVGPGTSKFNGSVLFNEIPHFNKGINIMGGTGHNTGISISDKVAVGPDTPNNASVELTFGDSLGADDLISGLFLSVKGGNFNGSGGTDLQASNAGINIRLEDDLPGGGGVYIFGSNQGCCPLLNASTDVLKSGKTYSIIENNRIIGNNSMRIGVFVNASGFFTTDASPANNTPVNASTLRIYNDGSDDGRTLKLTLTGSGEGYANRGFSANCSLQAFIRYESPFLHNHPDYMLSQ